MNYSLPRSQRTSFTIVFDKYRVASTQTDVQSTSTTTGCFPRPPCLHTTMSMAHPMNALLLIFLLCCHIDFPLTSVFELRFQCNLYRWRLGSGLYLLPDDGFSTCWGPHYITIPCDTDQGMCDLSSNSVPAKKHRNFAIMDGIYVKFQGI
ncbi:hypothetical protein GALMADRAFT_746749 [Galerina marginata CBS 339.88]|uniref:Uncharacterized protein n=1 Tax=Galerina marginata (strain CBS 339.88) TaxID=685588 RepID=A0A067SQ94_GALM3|nr:hypothetical protein GALMADRAFT_746749 [Galerina marginata CBS 339.88]